MFILYIVVFVIVLLFMGWLCLLWGWCKVFIVLVIGFIVVLGLCGLVGLLGGIVVARLL